MATLRTFEDGPLPSTVVVDSSFVFEALIDARQGDGRHELCVAFAQRLRAGGVRLVVSPLLFLEAPQCWRRLLQKNALPLASAGRYERDGIVRAFQDASALLREFLGEFDRWEIALSEDVLGLANVHAARYDLKSHDALVAAIASTTGVYEVVTMDADFEEVTPLTVWRGEVT